MRCRVIGLLMMCLTAAQSASAGAWMREKDTAFQAVSSALLRNSTGVFYESKVFIEYGFGPRLTVGLDVNEYSGGSGHALVFARVPLGKGDRRMQFAAEFGFGGHHWLGEWSKMYKAAVAVGRNFESRWGHGWMGLDAAFERRMGNARPIYKLDAVIGLSSDKRFRPMLKLETAYVSGKSLAWTLTPTVLIKGRKETTWVIGVEYRSARQNSIGMNVGFWRQF